MSNHNSLENDSPGFYSFIVKTRSKEEVTLIVEAYQKIGMKELPGIFREKEASFNPRAIRLARLFLEAEPKAEIEDIIAVMMEELDHSKPIEMYAYSLDTVRHLHVSDFSEKDKRVIIDNARNILTKLESLGRETEFKKLLHAITRQEQLL